MATPIRRRIAALVTCLALAFGTFGYMQRSATEVASDPPPPSDCDDKQKYGASGCLILYRE